MLGLFVPLLLAVALFTLVERKVMAVVQLRVGPSITGLFGLLQPIADGIKLLVKEVVVPLSAYRILFVGAPLFSLVLVSVGWVVIPFRPGWVCWDMALGILLVFGLSTLHVYSVVLAGWASQSSYALLGSLRSTAQLVAYELVLSSIILGIIILVRSLALSVIVVAQRDCWLAVPLFILFWIYMVGLLAESNRAPFDLPEAEAELVAGYNVEYAAFGFALFFLGEYCGILLFCSVGVILFLGGIYLVEKVVALAVFLILIRAAYPRFRYDHLMTLGWKALLPSVLAWSVLVFVLASLFNI